VSIVVPFRMTTDEATAVPAADSVDYSGSGAATAQVSAHRDG
jgi:hypothetical protein